MSEKQTSNMGNVSDNESAQSCSWNQVVIKRKITESSSTNTGLKIPRSNSSESSQTNNNPLKVNLPLSNRFEALSSDNLMDESGESPKTRPSKPPPIFLSSVVQYVPMCKVLKTIIGDNFRCSTTTKGITLYVTTPEAYRTCVKYLREQNADFHSYQLSEDKPFRVVIRGLHPSIDHEDLREELKSKGHAVRSISNVLSRTKEKLPLFFVDLEIAENNETIFDLHILMFSKIKVESPRPKRQLVQCTRCQQYGHTRTYCNHPHRCVRCAGSHDSSLCTKPKETPATCALCGQSHPSNYRGCTVYKELQKSRSPTVSRLRPSPQKQQAVPNIQDESQFPKVNAPNPSIPSSPKQIHCQHFTAENTQTNNCSPRNSSSSYSQVTANSDTTHQLNNFITEMKTLLTPLITLVSQLIQALVSQNGNK